MASSYIENIKEFLQKEHTRLNGYYNYNYVIEIAEKKYLLRIPMVDMIVMDIRLIPERELLLLLEKNRINAPRVIYEYKEGGQEYFLHNYIEGNTIEELYPENSRIPDWIVEDMVYQMSEYHKTPLENFDVVRDLIPWNYNTKEFYSYIYKFNRSLIEKYWEPYREIYQAFNFPNSVDDIIRCREDLIADYPFCLCHADIHRKNIIIQPEIKQANIIDWELSLIGNICYDISIHFHRMRYIKEQEELYFDLYAKHMGADLDMIKEQVDLYRELEEVKSVSIDVVRYITDIKEGMLSETDITSKAARYYTKLIKAYSRWNTPDSYRVEFEYVKKVFFSYISR